MSNEGDAQSYKVGRVIAKYHLDDVEVELVRRWTGEDSERASLRDLATYFNERVLRAAMDAVGMNPYDSEVADAYRALTDGTGGERAGTRRELARAGVDVEDVESDFVTYQAIYNYLTDVLDVTYRGESDEKQLENNIKKIEKLRSRVQVVVGDTLERFRNSGKISLGEFTVLVDIQVYCSDCGKQRGVVELLRAGGCSCDN